MNPNDSNRVSPEGRQLGIELARLTRPEIAKLIEQREYDSDPRCGSCAFKCGTVPNGCLQTQMDALKCVMEHTPFYCHVKKYSNGQAEVCAGWFAAMQAVKDKPKAECPWEHSPVDVGYDC